MDKHIITLTYNLLVNGEEITEYGVTKPVSNQEEYTGELNRIRDELCAKHSLDPYYIVPHSAEVVTIEDC